jgi:predicted lipoprotein with Yx(FWY)xxD motif
MRSAIPFVLATLLLALSPAFAATNGPAKIEHTSLGTVLANEHGMTLYTFKHDGHDKSSCMGKCAVNWPPFIAPADAKPSGHWSIVTRPDGTKQWAYKGHPLYTWKNDHAPGQTTGNGFLQGAWHVARP